jgi:Domain of unknown function (DUF222)
MSELLSVIDALAAVDARTLSEPDALVDLEELLRARDQLDGVIAARLQVADSRDVTVHECGRHTRSWLVEEMRLSPDEAGRRMTVARSSVFHPIVGADTLAGDISHDHARVILSCLRRLLPSWRELAESELVEAARVVDPVSLGRLCRELRLRTGADEDAEAAAQRRFESRWATITSTFDGMTHLEAMLDPECGAVLTAALAPLMTRAGEIDERTSSQRRADALVDLARRALDSGRLPDHGGDRPHVMAIVPFDELRDGVATRQLDSARLNGVAITAESARRIACDANILPAVLGSRGEVLDLGRSQRTWSIAQRRAAALRDSGCVFPGCQAGLERCQLHHLEFWANGGRSDLRNSAYVCHFHHWLVHHSTWTITRNVVGTIEVCRT